jgi:hypothetical protein
MLPGYSGIVIIVYTTVPVITVAIIPAGGNNVVDIVGETHTFKCNKECTRPAARIQWYNYYYLYYSTGDNSDNHTSW